MPVATRRVATTSRAPKRQPYKKSRRGFRNCKIREVKCNEAEDECHRCQEYGVVCNYDTDIPDLQLTVQGAQGLSRRVRRAPDPGAFIVFEAQKHSVAPSPSPGLVPTYTTADATTSFTLLTESVRLLDHFRTKTSHTLGHGASIQVHQELYPNFLFTSPCLMHACLAIASAHETYLLGPQAALDSRRRVRESFHRSECAALFNRKLSEPLRPEDRDSLWVTAASLGIIAFCGTDGTDDPKEAWPYRAPSPCDLEWLRMADGKMAVWHLIDPLREDSAFSGMTAVFAQLYRPVPLQGVHGIPPELVELFELDAESTAEDSPYFNTLHALARLMALPKDGTLTPIQTFTFMTNMPISFRKLMTNKDPRALLLIALWYQIAREACWFKGRRADLERISICLHLKEKYGGDEKLMRLLPWDVTA